MRLAPALAPLLLALVAAPAAAQAKKRAKTERKREVKSQPYYAAIGEGQTLPKGVLRVRIPYNYATAASGFDKDGNKRDAGLTLRASGTAFVLEYGATGNLSLQLLAPYVLSNELGLDADRFRKSDVYKKNYDEFLAGLGAKLQAQGICPSADACAQLIEGGYALPADTPVVLPSGETVVVKAGVPVKAYADSIVVGAARPAAGRTGLGDVELGFLYALFKRYDAGLSIGAGLRFPTGSFGDVPSAQRATGRGTTDLGIRFNADVSPFKGVWLSYQNQAELMLIAAEKTPSSLLDNNELAEADAQKFERKGVRNLGFFKLGWGLGNITQSLAPIGVQTQLKYARQSKEYLDGEPVGDPANSMSLLGGAVFDALAYRIPLQLQYDHEVPLSGANVTLAPTVQLLTLKAYYRF